jgi:Transglutaminase-like superfamily
MTSPSTTSWKSTARALMTKNPSGYKTMSTYCAVLDFIHKNNWQGSCHGSSAVLATLLVSQGLKPTLCLGEVFMTDFYFDHSWVEIDGEVLDAAISKTLIKGQSFPPVFYDRDLSTKQLTSLDYGKPSGQGYDASASAIRGTIVLEYMKMYPDHSDGLFGIAKAIGKGLNLRVSLSSLESNAAQLDWIEKP